MIGAIVLAICLICPLVDAFDQWDHALQTGSDSEYPLMIVALCVAVAFSLARLVAVFCSSVRSSGVRPAIPSAAALPTLLIALASLAPSPGSPPLNLRI